MKNNYLYFIIIAVLASFLATYLILNRFADKNRDETSEVLLKEKKESEERARKEYNDLLEKQARELSATKIGSSDNLKQRRALGSRTLSIVYIKPSTLSDKEILPLIERLNDQRDQVFNDCYGDKCISNTSLNFVTTYFLNEARKYGVSDLQLKINTYGPYDLTSLEKVGDIAYFWGKDPFGIAKLKDSFENVLRQNGLNFTENEMVVFLYFDSSLDDNEANKKVGFYEMKKFRSFADDERSRIYANVYNFSPLFATVVDKIVIHETMHLFGASDKYIEEEGDRVCKEEGRGEIYKIPTFPQNSGDIMCLFVEYADGKYKRGEIYDGSLVVNTITAREVGWVN